ncbi:MAG TPA: hypothetical protein VML75_14220, partial [Kofleriaceae bacterium]|nr:hypothetical protein [Kofleriaceae bacterium]
VVHPDPELAEGSARERAPSRRTSAHPERGPRTSANRVEGPDFNQLVLELIAEYEPGGGYSWPAPRGTHGTTRDLTLGADRIARGSGGPTHCSGLTFEIFWRTLERWSGGTSGAGLTPGSARALMRTWFVPDTRGQGPAAALPAHGLGRRIDRLEDARPGDFVQVWMNNGSGHTLIFLDWTRDADGRIVGVRHFSSHPVTDGIGITEREIGSGRRDIDPNAIHIARVEPPQ